MNPIAFSSRRCACAVILSLLAIQISIRCCESRGEISCGELCKTSEDCNSAGNCNVCAHDTNGVSAYACRQNPEKRRKVCMTHSQSCGGPPPAPQNESHIQYLAIGDPITRGWFCFLSKHDLLEGVDSYIIPDTPKTAADGLRCIDTWIGNDSYRWDVISFNFGAWDAASRSENSSNYAMRLTNITNYILNHTHFKGKRLIFMLTTPTPHINSCCANDSKFEMGPCPDTIQCYNAAAEYTLLSDSSYRASVIIADLWGVVNRYCCKQENCRYDSCDIQPGTNSASQCPIEFSEKGYQILAQSVSETIKSALSL